MKKNHLELLHFIEERITENLKHYNSSYINFVGFILALSGIFLGFKDLNKISEFMFLLTIIFITLGFYFYFKLDKIGIKKFQKLYKIVQIAIDNKQESISEDLNKNKNESVGEKILGKLIYLVDLGLILFLLGIIFIYYNK